MLCLLLNFNHLRYQSSETVIILKNHTPFLNVHCTIYRHMVSICYFTYGIRECIKLYLIKTPKFEVLSFRFLGHPIAFFYKLNDRNVIPATNWENIGCYLCYSNLRQYERYSFYCSSATFPIVLLTKSHY